MSKFRPYESPVRYLVGKIGAVNQLYVWYFKYNKFDDQLSSSGGDPRLGYASSFLGGLNPLFSIKKDFLDTFRPYKARFYIYRDMIQPLRGFGNVIRGLFNMVASLVLLVVNTFRYARIGITQKSGSSFVTNMATNLLKVGGGFLDGMISVIRGVGQLVTTPLTWLIRIPLRGTITAIKGMPTVRQNLEARAREVEKLVQKEKKTPGDAIKIDAEMLSFRRHLIKAKSRGQNTGLDTDEMLRKFSNCPKFIDERDNEHSGVSVAEQEKEKTLDFLFCFKTNTDSSDSGATVSENNGADKKSQPEPC